jgi:hypothetical protein
VLFTHVHAEWTQSLYAGMNAATPAAKATSAAKASSRAILTPRIPLQT